MNQCDRHLIDAAADPHVKRAQIVPRPQPKAGLGQFNGAEVPQIPQGQDEGQKLPQYSGQSCAKHTPAQAKNKDRIQNGIHDSSRYHTEHRIPGTSIRPDQVADAVGQNQERHAQQHDFRILPGKGYHLSRCSKHLQKRHQESFGQDKIKHPRSGHQNNAVSHQLSSPFPFFFSQVDGKTGGTADPQQQGNGKTDRRQRVGHISGRIAQIANTLTNKYLVHDIVKRADQSRRDAGNRKPSQ